MRLDSEIWNVEHLLRVLRNRGWVVVLCTALAGAGAVGASLVQRKMYTASASLLFRDPGFDQMIFGSSVLGTSQDPTRQAATNVDLVALPVVAGAASKALNGEIAAARIRNEVTVSSSGQADVATVNATDASQVLAARLANTYAEEYISIRREADRAKIAGAQSQIQQLLSGMPQAERNGPVGQSLLNRANQLRILAALQTGNAELVQPASVPTGPSSPKTARNAIFGVLLGLMVGFALAFLLERLDRRLQEPSDVEEAYGLPVLGAVPQSNAYDTTPLEPLPAGEAEAFALLRARLRYFNVDRDVRSLLVTSATPGEGKTTIALHLAMAEVLAGSSHVVIVEADLRRPSLARRLGLESHAGLAEVLSRHVTLDDALQHVPVPIHKSKRLNGGLPTPSLTVLTAGAIPPNPAEIIESRAMTDLLSALAERFEHVIIDSPPTSIVSDAIPLVAQVNGVIAVSRIGNTTREAARHLHEQLVKLNAPTLGVVANGITSRSRRYYAYTYAYGYSYESDPTEARSEEADATAVPG